MDGTQLGLCGIGHDVPRSRTYARPTDDWYPTPEWVPDAVLNELGYRFGGRVLDAGAGLGVLGRCVEKWRAIRGLSVPSITAVEFDERRCSQLPERWTNIQADFISWAWDQPAGSFDAAIMNSPFAYDGISVWTEWVDAALRLVKGPLLALGQITQTGGIERVKWLLERQRLHVVWVLDKRPVFRSTAGSSGPRVPFAWFEFRPWRTTSRGWQMIPLQAGRGD